MKAIPSLRPDRPERPRNPTGESSMGPCSKLGHHHIETPSRVYAHPPEKIGDILRKLLGGETIKIFSGPIPWGPDAPDGKLVAEIVGEKPSPIPLPPGKILGDM
jgi:hypothetical protein